MVVMLMLMVMMMDSDGKYDGDDDNDTNDGSYLYILALKNVALNKMTNQSSTAGGLGISDHAVDGNNNPSYFSGSCTHTNSTGTSPWWMVDLGQEVTGLNILIVYYCI